VPSSLTFTPGNHAYWLTDPDTGKKTRLTSVTTLIGLLAKPQLVKWAARVTAETAVDNWERLATLPPSERVRQLTAAPDNTRNRAAAKGTAIHGWAEELLAGLPVDVPEEHAGTVQAFARWWEGAGFTATRTEAMIGSPTDEYGGCGYAGTADLIATHPRHGQVIIDWKTGGVWPEHAIQVAAYSAADELATPSGDIPMPRIDTLLVAAIRPEGVALHTVTDDQRALATDLFTLLRNLKAIGKPQLREIL